MCTRIRFPYSCRGEIRIKDGTPRRPSSHLRLKTGDIHVVSGCPETAVKDEGGRVGGQQWGEMIGMGIAVQETEGGALQFGWQSGEQWNLGNGFP